MKVELSGHYGYWRIVKSMAPMAMMMIVTSVYTIVDGFFISNFAGSDAFAGMNIIWPAFALVGSLGMMVGAGGSALVSKTFGEGDPDKANRIFSMLVRLTLIIGALSAVLMFIFASRISKALGADEVLLPYSTVYGRILITMLPFYMVQVAFQPFYMVAERPELGTVMSVACGLANIVLDALFVAVFGWGLTGAAIATAISYLVGGLYPLWFFSSKRNHTHLKFVRCGFDLRSIAKSCSNGLSEFVGNTSLNIISICYNLQLMKYIGPDGVSAYGILMYVGFIFAAIFIGYNMGISQVIAFNYGAGRKEELTSILHKSIVIITVAGVILTSLAELSAPLIARCFFSYDAELCRLTVHAIRIYMLSFLLCGFNMFASAWFTALNNGVVSAIVAFVRTLILEMAAVFVLPLIFGIEGIWMSVNAAELLAFAMSMTLIFSFRKRYGY